MSVFLKHLFRHPFGPQSAKTASERVAERNHGVQTVSGIMVVTTRDGFMRATRSPFDRVDTDTEGVIRPFSLVVEAVEAEILWCGSVKLVPRHSMYMAYMYLYIGMVEKGSMSAYLHISSECRSKTIPMDPNMLVFASGLHRPQTGLSASGRRPLRPLRGERSAERAPALWPLADGPRRKGRTARETREWCSAGLTEKQVQNRSKPYKYWETVCWF